MSFVIADFSLKGMMGHPLAYDMSVRDAALAAGWNRVVTLANRKAGPEVARLLDSVACFTCDIDDNLLGPGASHLPRWLYSRLNMRAHCKRILRDLSQVESGLFDAGQRNLVLFPTVRHPQLVPIFKWVEHLNRQHHVDCGIVLHFTGFPDFEAATYTGDHYRRALAYLEKSPARNRIRLFADSRELVEEYAYYTSHPVEVVPIPHMPSCDGSNATSPGGGPPRLVYLGDARTNKGYHLLGDLFVNLRAELAAGQIVAEIQSNLRIDSEWEARWAKQRLAELPNVIVHDSALTPEQYDALVGRTDLALAPYTRLHYHSQTSGVVAEVLAAGKPLIAPRGTWASKEAKRLGCGVVEFLPEDAQSLLESVRFALAHLDELTAKAREAAPRWRQFHCFENYLKIITQSNE